MARSADKGESMGSEGLVTGKKALVVGVANKRSIAWAIAKSLDAAGAQVALTYQGERTERDVRKLAAELANPGPIVPLDVQDDAQTDAAVAAAVEGMGGIDTLVQPSPMRSRTTSAGASPRSPATGS